MRVKVLQFLRQKIKPRTVVSTDKKKSLFNTVNKDLQKYENIYRKGGLISQAVDAYPLFGLGAGYVLDGAPGDVKVVEDWFYKIDIDVLMWQAWVDALVYGDGIQEDVFSRKGEMLYCVPRNPLNFTINVDGYGMIEGYTQRVDNKDVVLLPEKVTNLTLLTLSGEAYGQSLVGRAIDDVMRDTRTAESTAVAIERHGYPRFHIKAGSEDSDYSDEDKKQIASEFEELKADNEFISDPDIDIVAIDVPGIGKISTYNEWSLGRLLGAMGVPSEVIGTGQNVSTYATASVEMVSFFKRVEAMQVRVARCFNGLIDKKMGEGRVKMTFNKIDRGALVEVEGTEE